MEQGAPPFGIELLPGTNSGQFADTPLNWAGALARRLQGLRRREPLSQTLRVGGLIVVFLRLNR
jgi:hypothetical protein